MADENTEITASPTVTEKCCTMCGEDECERPLLLLFECQHYIHQECHDERDEAADQCPECQADYRPQPARLCKALSEWTHELVVTIIAFVILVPVSVVCKMYTQQAEDLNQEALDLRQRNAYWQCMLREPTLCDWRYIGASLLYKFINTALSCLVGVNIASFFYYYWQNA